MPITITTSSIPTLKANLKAALQARAGLSGVQVSWGWPSAPAKEMILLGDVRDGTQDPAGMRSTPHHRDETYSVEVTIWVERIGADQQSATERAFELAAEIEDELRNDLTVGGAVRTAQVQGRVEIEERASDRARLALLTINVHCKARL